MLNAGKFLRNGENGSSVITFSDIDHYCWSLCDGKYCAEELTSTLRNVIEENESKYNKLKQQIKDKGVKMLYRLS